MAGEVVIVGAGLAGLSAAVERMSRGVEVIVLEASGAFGVSVGWARCSVGQAILGASIGVELSCTAMPSACLLGTRSVLPRVGVLGRRSTHHVCGNKAGLGLGAIGVIPWFA